MEGGGCMDISVIFCGVERIVLCGVKQIVMECLPTKQCWLVTRITKIDSWIRYNIGDIIVVLIPASGRQNYQGVYRVISGSVQSRERTAGVQHQWYPIELLRTVEGPDVNWSSVEGVDMGWVGIDYRYIPFLIILSYLQHVTVPASVYLVKYGSTVGGAESC